MTSKAIAWDWSDEQLIDELSRISYWAGVEMDGVQKGYPSADNKDEALGLIAETVARMAKKILLVSKE